MFDSNVMVVKTTSTRKKTFDDYEDDLDVDALQSRSRRTDANLVNNINARLNRLEFDNVNVGKDVAIKTGFRRHLYQQAQRKVDSEVRDEIRMDRLRFPWDYTRDNIFRTTKKKKGEKAKLESAIREYPEYDPYGVYNPIMKRERKPEPEGPTTADIYAKMNATRVFARCKAKATLKQIERDPSEDVDSIINEFSRPLPKSEVKDYVPHTGGLYDFVEFDYGEEDKLDPIISKKIEAGRKDLADFEKLLDERKKAPRAVTVSKVKRLAYDSRLAYDAPYDDRRETSPLMWRLLVEREYALDDYYGLEDELDSAPMHRPTRTVHRSVRASSVPIARRFSNVRGISHVKVTPSNRVRPVTLSSHSFLNDNSSSHIHRAPLHRAGSAQRSMHPRAAKYAAYEDDDYFGSYSPPSYASLRLRAADARAGLGQHKVMLDRYLPLSMGTPVPVPYEVEAKYGELADRMPGLDPHRGALARDSQYDLPRASSVPRYTPYKPAPRPAASPAPAGGAYRAPSYRPPMSEVRRRAREVMCKTKNDPRYYDY